MWLAVVLKVDLSEMAGADTLVLSVSATDRDSGLNGEITYRLLSSPLQGFHVQPDSGKTHTEALGPNGINSFHEKRGSPV